MNKNIDPLLGLFQLPAYEFSFQDVNPPVHAYAVLRVYKASGPKNKRDLAFLARCFHKLILNFTWYMTVSHFYLLVVDSQNVNCCCDCLVYF